MASATELGSRRLVRPDGGIVIVVTRRSGRPGRPAKPAATRKAPTVEPRRARVWRGPFSPPVMRALAVLAGRARTVGREGVALDGSPAPLSVLIAEANRVLSGRGVRPIAYPGVRAI